MPFVYVTEQGAYVRKKGPHVQVAKDGETLADYTVREVRGLVVFGGVTVTTEALSALLREGCDISFLTLKGHFRGRVVSATGKNSVLRQAQYRCLTDPERRLAMAHRYVAAKVANGIDVLTAYHRNRYNRFVFSERKEMQRLLQKVRKGVEGADRLRGLEGSCARLYFGAFGRCLLNGRAFPGRIYHPSTDPVNALLSFGYSFVAREIQAMLHALGLDPFIGFFHEVTYGRASLSLDLMEEFRHPLVDRLVLKLFNKRVLDDGDFETGDSRQVYLKKESLKVFVRHYEEWANAVNRAWNDDGELSWRRAMWKQVEKLRGCIETGEAYTPFFWKEEQSARIAPGAGGDKTQTPHEGEDDS